MIIAALIGLIIAAAVLTLPAFIAGGLARRLALWILPRHKPRK